MKILLLLLVPSIAFAGIFGADTRHEAQRDGDNEVALRARSVPALVRKSMLNLRADGDFDAKPYTGERMGFCSDAKFADQPFLANCSSTLIGEDLVLTAAHCIQESMGVGCDDYRVVFDFAVGENLEVIAKEKVYNCKEVLYYKFDQTLQSDDIAVIRLDRKVTDREVIPVATRQPRIGEELTMIGYPLGLPQKAVSDGRVSSNDAQNVSFKHNLDTFSCNSGGPIFAPSGAVLGVLVRGTGPNTRTRSGENCQDWAITDGPDDYAEGNSLAHLKRELRLFGALIEE